MRLIVPTVLAAAILTSGLPAVASDADWVGQLKNKEMISIVVHGKDDDTPEQTATNQIGTPSETEADCMVFLCDYTDRRDNESSEGR